MVSAGAGGGAGDVMLYYGRSGSAFGADAGNGQRVVDFSNPANIDRCRPRRSRGRHHPLDAGVRADR